MKIFAIANQKGGCGKTTVAINLSAALTEKGKKILLIDLDPQSHASFGLRALKTDPYESIFSLFTGEIKKSKKLAEIILTAESGLDIVPSHIILSTVEHELKDREDAILILTTAISRAGLNYDYIIIDCPPNLGFLTFNALRAADEIIVPIETGIFSIMGVGKLISMIELIKTKLHHAPEIKGLLNMYDDRYEFSHKMLIKIKHLFKDKLLATTIPYDIAIKIAQAKSLTIFQADPKSKAGESYFSLASELLKLGIQTSTESIYQEMRKILRSMYGNAYSKERVFRFYAPDAKEVYVVGDFNNWKMDASGKLEKIDDGNWVKSFQLLPGRYRYKFVADGLWLWDPRNPEKEPNSYGDFDSVFKI